MTEKTKQPNTKQRVFIEHYLECWNASEAARLAGYKGKSNVVGPRLLADVSIQAAIKERLDEITMSASEVLVRLAQQARFDPLHFAVINEDKVYIDLEALKKAGLGGIVKKISYDKFGSLVVEFHDAQDALKLIGQHHKLFTQQHEHDVPALAPLLEILSQQVKQVYGGSD